MYQFDGFTHLGVRLANLDTALRGVRCGDFDAWIEEALARGIEACEWLAADGSSYLEETIRRAKLRELACVTPALLRTIAQQAKDALSRTNAVTAPADAALSHRALHRLMELIVADDQLRSRSIGCYF
jgi:hypothetical protein